MKVNRNYRANPIYCEDQQLNSIVSPIFSTIHLSRVQGRHNICCQHFLDTLITINQQNIAACPLIILLIWISLAGFGMIYKGMSETDNTSFK
jgi:hypothetical protein